MEVLESWNLVEAKVFLENIMQNMMFTKEYVEKHRRKETFMSSIHCSPKEFFVIVTEENCTV